MKKKIPPLTPDAIADGAKSGLSEADMLKCKMYSLTPQEMYAEFNIEASGYAIPYDDKYSFVRAKILSEKTRFNGTIKRKYTQKRGTKAKLYLPLLGSPSWEKIYNDINIPLIVTEGEKKAIAARKSGYACIGLAGVNCFGNKDNGLLPDWDKFKLSGREVYIIYDSDIAQKPQVRWAEYSLSLKLIERGAIVSRIKLPSPHGEKCGLDDFLVANGFPKDINRAREAFDKLPREKIDSAFPPHLTELGNAIRFEYAYNDHIRYVPQLKSWIVYNEDTGLWQHDEDGEVMRCAKKIPYSIKKEAEKIDNEKAQEAYNKWANISESEKNLKATIKLASSERGLIVNLKDIDSDPWVISFKNAQAINLKTLKRFSISHDDFFMNSLGISYNSDAKCPMWERFVSDIMNNDKELIKYLQRIVGWCLTGDTSEQCFFVLYGIGANGKSTFLNTLLALFGDYGRQASPQTFMSSKQDSSTRSDLVRLRNARLIATSETENNHRLAEGLIKQWTGGEEISTRDLYSKTFEFLPQGKILLATNHKPRIIGTDNGIWRRVHLIPFTRTFSENEKDTKLPEKLKAELQGIFNWALDGYKDWQKIGLSPPDSVLKAVNSYREDMDAIGAWLKEKCEISPENMELIANLFQNYKDYADHSEEYVLNKRLFVQQMEDRGFKKMQTTVTNVHKAKTKGWFLKGVSLTK